MGIRSLSPPGTIGMGLLHLSLYTQYGSWIRGLFLLYLRDIPSTRVLFLCPSCRFFTFVSMAGISIIRAGIQVSGSDSDSEMVILLGLCGSST
ncbi:hypothetical protein IWX49DRAFT_314624 [Phyllosticta citricarpa]|uniref:Uncharacterized protein n=1 Tax=Phyllosticta citricarpa TaxID=55181 RepID=A0ABR1LE33_9PEZI